MRIIYLHQYFVTPQMSGGTRSYEMARRIVAQGHEVHMVTTDRATSRSGADLWRESVEAGIHVHWAAIPYDNRMSYSARIWAFLRFAYEATRRAVALKPDLVFATSTPLTIAIPAVLSSRRAGCPMVFEVRDLWPAVPIAIGAIRNPLLKWASRHLERFAYRNATRVVALAPGMRDEIVGLGYPGDQVVVIPNGCDLDVYGGNDDGDLRRSHAWLGSRPILLFCGTFGLVNGVDYLAYLAQALAAIGPDVRIVAIGTGREYDRVVALAGQLNVNKRNLFFLGELSKRESARWLMTADMTIALFTGPEIVWRDAVQNKFFDSLAAGKPVANNFPGWQAKVAVEAGAGLIVSATDFPAAAKDICDALHNEKWMTGAQAACRALAGLRFNRDNLANDLLKVLLAAQGASRESVIS